MVVVVAMAPPAPARRCPHIACCSPPCYESAGYVVSHLQPGDKRGRSNGEGNMG